MKTGKLYWLLGAVMTMVTVSSAAEDKVDFTAEDFKCLTEMTPVRGFFVDNLLGNLDDTIAAAEQEKDVVFPVGSARIQLRSAPLANLGRSS